MILPTVEKWQTDFETWLRHLWDLFPPPLMSFLLKLFVIYFLLINIIHQKLRAYIGQIRTTTTEL
jgi:hypothetical protein